MQKLAAQLARRMPWLARDEHIGGLARLLQHHRLDVEAGWSADRVLRVLEQYNRDAGQLVVDPADQRNPLGYLQWLLTAAATRLREAEPAPRPAPRVEPAWRREDAERRRLLAAEDPAVRAAIIAQIRADIAATSPAPVRRRSRQGRW